MIDPLFIQKVLLEQNYITDEDVKNALEYEKSNKGTFTDYLFQEGILSQSTLGSAIAEHYNIPFFDLDSRLPSSDELAKISESVARKYRVIFVKEKEGEITVATDTPDSKELKKVIEEIFSKKKILYAYAFPESIDSALSHYEKELNTRFSEIIKKEKGVAPELLEEIIKDALTYRASDIHFEPQGDKAYIRFRVDGMLHLAGVITKEYFSSVLNRIKIQANLRTDEHFMPQDGAIRFVSREISVDLRVSIVPTLDGEKVVIRILAEYVRGLNFNDLGFTEKHVALFEAISRKPFGMILVSGPTGSGKTTTLYTLIKRINTPEVNVTTIEDPVEYRMVGANQIQVNQKTGLTFAKGLRAVVRQDPNIILVGEIRDGETAETAINAALTGHLLLSTFHANDAATSIPRLLEMGVEPFLLASTLELLVAQRLIRCICETCKYSYEEKTSEITKQYPGLQNYFSNPNTTLYKGKGCPSCNMTGYKGRTSIVEMIEVTPAIKALINKHPSAGEVWNIAKEQGSLSLFEDGIEKVKTGLTTLEEVYRVASPQSM